VNPPSGAFLLIFTASLHRALQGVLSGGFLYGHERKNRKSGLYNSHKHWRGEASCPCPPKERKSMVFDLPFLAAIVALIFGILILIVPRLLNYIVAIYLIVIGIIGILAAFT
jgi:hypothetical protein